MGRERVSVLKSDFLFILCFNTTVMYFCGAKFEENLSNIFDLVF